LMEDAPSGSVSVGHQGGYKAGWLWDGLNIFEEVQQKLEESALLIFDRNDYHARNLTVIGMPPPRQTNYNQRISPLLAILKCIKTKKHGFFIELGTL
jgi:hypothetical protein